MRAALLALMMSLMLIGPAAASEGAGKAAPGEEIFTLKELRVPLADSDPVRIMTVQLMLVMDSVEAKAAMRSQQKALEKTLAEALTQVPSQIAATPGAPNDVKKVVAQTITKSGVKGVKDILIKQYLLW